MNEELQSHEVLTTSDVSGDNLVDDVRRELEEIDAADITEHAARFNALHTKLEQSLRSIDNL
jgi:hypothetical protein